MTAWSEMKCSGLRMNGSSRVAVSGLNFLILWTWNAERSHQQHEQIFMKTVIAGSRGITNYSVVEAAVEHSGFTITQVVSGAAKGVDSLGEEYARRHRIPVNKNPADWSRFGRSAGPKRNKQMAEDADALIAVW